MSRATENAQARDHVKPISRLRWIWLILVAATSISFVAFKEVLHSPAGITLLIVGLAYFKARLVLLDFMELRHAPVAWRLAFEIWLAAASLLILAFCLLG